MRFANLTMRTKLVSAFLVVSLLPLFGLGFWSNQLITNSLLHESEKQLESVREIKKSQLVNLLETRRSDLSVLLDTVGQLRQAAFSKLNSIQSLKRSQIDELFKKFMDDILLLMMSKDVQMMLLDYEQYEAQTGAFDVYTTRYKEIHTAYYPFFTRFIENFGYSDVCIVDPEGRVRYTYAWNNDMGQDLVNGKLKDEGLGKLWAKVSETGNIAVVDFAPYSPNMDQQSAFIGAPIFDEFAQLKCMIALQISPDQLNTIALQREGMGETGETFLVSSTGGKSGLRSDRPKGRENLTEFGADLGVFTPRYIKQALDGENIHGVYQEQGQPLSFVAAEPVNLFDLEWAMASKIDLEEALTEGSVEGQKDLFADYASKYGYSDLLLINTDGSVFYTVAHNADYETNLMDGPYADSALGRLMKKVMETGKFAISDFKPYPANGNKPVAFMAQPLFKDGKIEMVVALQMPQTLINEIMLERDGMGRTAQTYLVGQDLRLRSDTFRDPETHSVVESFRGNIEANGVNTESANKALEGETATMLGVDYKGTKVLASFTPVEFEGLHWALVADIASQEVLSPVAKLQNALLYGLLPVAAIILLTGFWLANAISRPLRKCVEYSACISDGDYDCKLDVYQDDEVGQLSESLRTMVATLQDKIDEATSTAKEASEKSKLAEQALEDVRQAQQAEAEKMETIRATANRIESVVQQLESSSSSLSERIEKVSHGAQLQAEHTRETTGSMQEMNNTVLEVASNASRAAEHSSKTRAQAVDGSAVVERSVLAIRKVNDNARAMSEQMIQMQQQTESIGQVMGVISDIADQTNLLALNAAIEAARAGDAGRGFAVVADEVRKLAEKTMHSTQEVHAAVGSIQSGSRSSLEGMDAVLEAVEQATRLAEDSGQSLQQIVAIADGTAEQVERIASASEQQSATSEQVNGALEQIDSIAADTLRGMNEAVSAVDDVTYQMKALQSIVAELAQHK